MFPDLFRLAVDKASIASYLSGGQGWNPHFSRTFQDWGLEAVDSFFDLLYSCFPQGQADDQASWTLTKSGKLEVCCRSWLIFVYGHSRASGA